MSNYTTVLTVAQMNEILERTPGDVIIDFSRGEKLYGFNRYLSLRLFDEEHKKTYRPMVRINTVLHSDARYMNAKFDGASLAFTSAEFAELARKLKKHIDHEIATNKPSYLKERDRLCAVSWAQTSTKGGEVLPEPIIRAKIPFAKVGDKIADDCIAKARYRYKTEGMWKTFTYSQCNDIFKRECEVSLVLDISTIVVSSHGANHHLDVSEVVIDGHNHTLMENILEVPTEFA